jgi:hypothetical protein
MMFLTLDGEQGLFEVTVFPDACRSLRGRMDGYGPYVVGGIVEDQYGSLTISARQVSPLSAPLSDAATGWLRRKWRVGNERVEKTRVMRVPLAKPACPACRQAGGRQAQGAALGSNGRDGRSGPRPSRVCIRTERLLSFPCGPTTLDFHVQPRPGRGGI